MKDEKVVQYLKNNQISSNFVNKTIADNTTTERPLPIRKASSSLSKIYKPPKVQFLQKPKEKESSRTNTSTNVEIDRDNNLLITATNFKKNSLPNIYKKRQSISYI